MSDESNQPHELSDLEPLEELPEEAESLPGKKGTPSSSPGKKRELEQAPLQLRKAAKILLAGGLLPMAGVRITEFPDQVLPWANLYGAKTIALVGMWLFYQGYVSTHGGASKIGAIDKAAKAHPLVIPGIATVLAVLSMVYLFSTPILDGASFWAKSTSFTEVATVILAAATLAHIYGYEHGAKFNPIFPLMFLGPGIGGVFAIFNGVTAMTSTEGNAKLAAGLGLLSNLIAGFGGCMAMWVMYKSMRQAKIEGDIKKAAMREARKAARQARG